MEKSILVDMDLTLNNFLQHFCEFAYTIHKMTFEGNVFDTYELCYHMTKSEEENLRVKNEIFSDSLFWKTLSPLPDSNNVLMKLQNKGYKLSIATMLPPKSSYALQDMIKKEKFAWLKKYYPTIKFQHIYVNTSKFNIKADYLIDDYYKNIGDDAHRFSGKWIKMMYDFNKLHKADYDVLNWKQIDKLFEDIEKGAIA